MSEDLHFELIRALELFGIERRPDSSIVAITRSPSWLTPILEASDNVPFNLGEMFPFLESFMGEAEVFWNTGAGGRIVSGAFAVTSGSEELMLRASALKLGSRCVMVLEPLRGEADARPVLQKARDNKLENERLLRQGAEVQTSLTTISQLATQLLKTELTGAQRELAERLNSATARAQSVAAGEQRRG